LKVTFYLLKYTSERFLLNKKYELNPNGLLLEPKASFVKKLPDITLAVQGSDIKLTVELSKPDVPVKWLR